MNDALDTAILAVLELENLRPISVKMLLYKVAKLHPQLGYIKFDDFQKVVAELKIKEQIKQLVRGDYVICKSKKKVDYDNENILEGKISINSVGNGFITATGQSEPCYYVHKDDLQHAQNGDVVRFVVAKQPIRPNHNLQDASIVDVVQHAKDSFVGEFVLLKDQEYQVLVDDSKFNLQIRLDDVTGLVNGHKILFKINKYDKNTAYATLEKVIGHKSDIGTDILSIVLDNGVEPDFTDEVINYAKKQKIDLSDPTIKIRRDLCDKPIITIDPATSKDFDDAFYCEKKSNNEYLLSVHIADVSHYVKYQSALDKAAISRGCSIYLVDRVIPMLPHNLSDDICSINPNVERFAIGCDMIINENGEFKKIEVYPSLIKSHRRFSYDEVNEYIEKKTDFSKEEVAVKKSVDAGIELSGILSAMKTKRGYIDFEIPEPNIIVDDSCVPIDIKIRTHGRAQKMIEDFMVAANEAVTIFAEKNNLPFIYRIHEKPNELRLQAFALHAKKMGLKINVKLDSKITPLDLSKLLEDNKENENIELIRMILLRSMMKAKYSEKNLGHFGLGSKNYTHFTSPIRRYPDLLVHRIF
jgi:ribonuclease R